MLALWKKKKKTSLQLELDLPSILLELLFFW